MDSGKQKEVIIVGLGIVGISAAYYLSRQGVKVKAFEQHDTAGALGTSSYGYSRIWRYAHRDAKYMAMMQESEPYWYELESKYKVKILYKTGMLDVAEPGQPDLQDILDNNYAGERMSGAQIMAKWPALVLDPKDIGFWSYDAGYMDCHAAFDCLQREALAQGAELFFNTKVVSVDDNEGQIVLENGKVFKADQIVVSSGWETPKFKPKDYFDCTVVPTDTFYLEDDSGLPPVFRIYRGDDCHYFGLKDGPGLKGYKVGVERHSDAAFMVEKLKLVLPSKIPKVISKHACYYTETGDKEFIFRKIGDRAFYCFGFSGTGFKHGPYHGKRIFHLLNGDKEALKYSILNKDLESVMKKEKIVMDPKL